MECGGPAPFPDNLGVIIGVPGISGNVLLPAVVAAGVNPEVSVDGWA